MAINLTWKFVEPELDAIAAHEGRVVVIVSSDAKIDQLGRRVNKLTRGAVSARLKVMRLKRHHWVRLSH